MSRQLLRTGLLQGTALLLAGAGAAPVADAIEGECKRLGARAAGVQLEGQDDLGAAALAAAQQLGALDLLVLDAGSMFAAAAAAVAGSAQGARAALDSSLQASWEVTRAIANAAFIEPGRPGRIIYVTPPDDGGGDELARHARAARAGLENLARTLSIEWSRFPVTTVAIAPGAHTQPHQVASLCAYLASPAGAYFSGCLLDLSGPSPASRASERAR